MKLMENEKAQGATEYLLIFAAALAIVAVAIYYVMEVGSTGESLVENQAENVENQLP